MDTVKDYVSALTDIKPAKEEPVPSGLDWNEVTDTKRNQEWTIIAIVLANPQQVIDVATKDPNKLLNDQLPYGALKVLFTGTEKQCVKKERKYLDSNEFNKVLRVRTGVWVPIADMKVLKDNVVREVIDSKARSILFSEKVKAKSKFKDDREAALRRKEVYDNYDTRIDNVDDIMHYVQLKINQRNVSCKREEAIKIIDIADKTLVNINNKLQQVEEMHPEFIDKWKDQLEVYTTDVGITNPYNI